MTKLPCEEFPNCPIESYKSKKKLTLNYIYRRLDCVISTDIILIDTGDLDYFITVQYNYINTHDTVVKQLYSKDS